MVIGWLISICISYIHIHNIVWLINCVCVSIIIHIYIYIYMIMYASIKLIDYRYLAMISLVVLYLPLDFLKKKKTTGGTPSKKSECWYHEDLPRKHRNWRLISWAYHGIPLKCKISKIVIELYLVNGWFQIVDDPSHIWNLSWVA